MRTLAIVCGVAAILGSCSIFGNKDGDAPSPNPPAASKIGQPCDVKIESGAILKDGGKYVKGADGQPVCMSNTNPRR